MSAWNPDDDSLEAMRQRDNTWRPRAFHSGSNAARGSRDRAILLRVLRLVTAEQRERPAHPISLAFEALVKQATQELTQEAADRLARAKARR